MTDRILLAGISIRMLAELAIRAGYDVIALDYFGDADLRAICPSLSILRDLGGRYNPATLAAAAEGLEASTVAYSASFENHPQQVARLARGRRLLGNTPETLLAVRDPGQLAAALAAGGLRFPQTLPAHEQQRADRSRRWLVKPRRSGGGHGVRQWRGGKLDEGSLLQAQVAGMVCSAAFVANGKQAVLLGISEQLVGLRAFGARRFRYCGNLTPPRLAPPERAALLAQLRQAATLLTRRFGLRGLNGVDAVWDGQHAWILEVNPRPSASLELFEHVYNLHVFAAHVQSFDGLLPSFELEHAVIGAQAAAKTIMYAARDLAVGDTANWHALGRRDIPHSGESIRRGHPICTLLTTGTTPESCARRLRAMADELEGELHG
jgi:predicted ATP-grasp superfamily ATP-dependent carboligase